MSLKTEKINLLQKILEMHFKNYGFVMDDSYKYCLQFFIFYLSQSKVS